MRDFSCKIVDRTATIVIAMITTVKDTVKNAKLVEALATVFLKEVFQKGALKNCLLQAKKVPAKGNRQFKVESYVVVAYFPIQICKGVCEI